MKKLILGLTASSVVSCIPLPHVRTLASPQEGVLLLGGKPVSGVKVLQSFGYQDKECEEATRETVTDAQGAFSFPARRPLSFFISIGDDYHYNYLCAEHDGRRKWLTFSSIVHETTDKPMRFECDLGTAIQSEFPAGTRKDLPHLRCKLAED